MSADAILLGILAIVDLALIVHLRRMRQRQLRERRLARSLKMAIERGSSWEDAPRRGLLSRAS